MPFSELLVPCSTLSLSEQVVRVEPGEFGYAFLRKETAVVPSNRRRLAKQEVQVDLPEIVNLRVELLHSTLDSRSSHRLAFTRTFSWIIKSNCRLTIQLEFATVILGIQMTLDDNVLLPRLILDFQLEPRITFTTFLYEFANVLCSTQFLSRWQTTSATDIA